MHNGATFTPGEVGQACQFNGTGAFVSFGPKAGNFGTSDFSVEFWIRTTSKRLEGIIGKRPTCDASDFWDIRLGSGHPSESNFVPGVISFELDQDASVNINTVHTTRTVNDGAFHHVGLVRSAHTISVYVDGLLDVTHTSAGLTNVSNSFVLAAGISTCTGSADGTQSLTGQLDEVALYARALSSSEIQGH